jgi:hypothetical protein
MDGLKNTDLPGRWHKTKQATEQTHTHPTLAFRGEFRALINYQIWCWNLIKICNIKRMPFKTDQTQFQAHKQNTYPTLGFRKEIQSKTNLKYWLFQ